MKVLAVGCHPDDTEIGCGGTLACCAERGDEVTICHVANGNMGHVLIPPDELRLIRAEEAQRAGHTLGAREVVSLDVPDLLVNAADPAVYRAMTDLIRRVNPDFIITHAPDDYMLDHTEVSKLVFTASFSSTLAHFGEGAPALSVMPIYYMDTLAGVNFQPTHYVDVSGFIERKLLALSRHESQVRWMLEHDHIDFADMVRTCSRYRGYQSGVAFAEGFKVCTVYPRMTTKHLLP